VSARLIPIVRAAGSPRVLVVGDLLLDRYIFGEVRRISPEAPIQVLNVTDEESRCGGAGSVALHLAALGSRVSLVGIIGDDDRGATFRRLAGEQGVDVSGLVVETGRPTSVKSRHIARGQKHNQQVLRVDRESVDAPTAETVDKLMRLVQTRVPKADVVILSDYAKGTLGHRVLREAIRTARRAKVRVLVDPKGQDYAPYRGASAVTPNRQESQEATGIAYTGPRSLEKIGRKLVDDLGLEAAVVTLDREGVALFPKDDRTIRIPSTPREIYDITGAGDAVIATLGWALAVGAGWKDAAALANVAGGIEVGKLGVTPIPREELLEALHEGSPETAGKVKSREELLEALAARRARGERIVFTNGCFDLLHTGHVRYLRFARDQGDCLVIGLNSDVSVRKQGKGDDRPVQPESDRAETLAALECVDLITTFDEPTPLRLIQKARPDVLVKGEDWREKGVVGRGFVERSGGRVVLAPLYPGHSTSDLIDRIRGEEGA
jgi:D-beta-D-heptose 7-phosphate kinase / D-beta-D-heptose 1-phosphate adenosyltransferase